MSTIVVINDVKIGLRTIGMLIGALRNTLRSPLHGVTVAALAVATGLVTGPAAATALERQAGEAAALEDCNRRTCTMLQERKAAGDDLKCDLTKTWPQSTIKRADSLILRWGFGDARCSVQLHVKRTDIVDALTLPAYKLEASPHTAECAIEEAGAVRTIKATLSPKIAFENGKAKKIWINLISADGAPSLTRFLWVAAKLEDTTGLFQRAMVNAVNKYIYAQCPSKYPQSLANPKS